MLKELERRGALRNKLGTSSKKLFVFSLNLSLIGVVLTY
jgi:hypothetical protein